MLTDKMKQSYNNYLEEHIENVKLGFEWMLINLRELFKGYDSDYLGELISNHDKSKYSIEEYEPYAEYFYGDSKNSEETLNEFNLAWLHHQHNNPHHWQHWLLREDDGNFIALEMPYEYIIEMIADWWAFSWKSDNLYEIFTWYENNTEKQLLHQKTKETVEYILAQLKEKLDEIHS